MHTPPGLAPDVSPDVTGCHFLFSLASHPSKLLLSHFTDSATFFLPRGRGAPARTNATAAPFFILQDAEATLIVILRQRNLAGSTKRKSRGFFFFLSEPCILFTTGWEIVSKEVWVLRPEPLMCQLNYIITKIAPIWEKKIDVGQECWSFTRPALFW